MACSCTWGAVGSTLTLSVPFLQYYQQTTATFSYDFLYQFCCAWYIRWASQVAPVVKNLPANAGDMRHEFSSWVCNIPWRRAWQPTPVFLPGESRGQRNWLAAVLRVAESDRTEVTRDISITRASIFLNGWVYFWAFYPVPLSHVLSQISTWAVPFLVPVVCVFSVLSHPWRSCINITGVFRQWTLFHWSSPLMFSYISFISALEFILLSFFFFFDFVFFFFSPFI